MFQIRNIFVTIFTCYTCTTLAQQNFLRFETQGQVSANRSYGDINFKIPVKQTMHLGLDYVLTPYIRLSLTLQYGTLSAGDSVQDTHNRFFENHYHSVSASNKLSLGILQRNKHGSVANFLSGLYVHYGAGIIRNDQRKIIRVKLRADHSKYAFPGKNKSLSAVFPAGAGLLIPLHSGYTNYPYWFIHFQCCLHIIPGDQMDGYSDPREKFRNRSPDMFTSAGIGISYAFGPEGFYWKNR